MAYYTTPAAANYYTAPAHTHRQRGFRLCDQCGIVEQPAIRQFRLCGGCVRLRPSHISHCESDIDRYVSQMTTNYCVSHMFE